VVVNQTSRQVVGTAAEDAVVRYVDTLGWRLLNRNVRVGHYEIDILAQDGRTLVIIEVRHRGERSLTSGFGSLSATKRIRVRRAGERLWHSRFRYDSTIDRMRFDAASVHFDASGHPEIEYALAAF
jgi:putative endonuclease